MSYKRKGHITTSGEWANHLRPIGRRFYWKGERAQEREIAGLDLDYNEHGFNKIKTSKYRKPKKDKYKLQKLIMFAAGKPTNSFFENTSNITLNEPNWQTIIIFSDRKRLIKSFIKLHDSDTLIGHYRIICPFGDIQILTRENYK